MVFSKRRTLSHTSWHDFGANETAIYPIPSRIPFGNFKAYKPYFKLVLRNQFDMPIALI